MKERIDVLLATYNGEKYLKEQIDSILNQTYKNIRLIISDDCSKDNTPKILKEYEKADSRVVVHFHQKNMGVTKNFEYLLNQVESNLYMTSDQDDVWLPQKIEKSYETLKSKKADLVFGDLEVVDENLKTIYPSFCDYMLLTRKIKKQINSYKLNYLYNCITGCTVLSKKKFLKYILPIPDTSKFMVQDFWMAIMVGVHNGKFAYMEEKYIKYRQHGNNVVGTDKIWHGFSKFEEVRNHFINVKLGIFGTYVENNNRFPKEIQEINTRAYEYFKGLKEKKYFNFKGWKTYHELYKNETFMYYIENFCILNLPLIGKVLFKVRYAILKLLKKR